MTTTKAAKERHQNRQPELARYLDSIEAYDTVYLVYPNWWNGIPMAVHTFLKQYDFSGKQIRPCVPAEEVGWKTAFKEIKSVCQGPALTGDCCFRSRRWVLREQKNKSDLDRRNAAGQGRFPFFQKTLKIKI